MTEPTPAFFASRIVGLSGSVFLSGFGFSASYLGLSALKLAPIPLRLKQWQVIYDNGKVVSPTVAAVSSAVWGYVAWASYSQGGSSDWKFFATAGLASFAILPFTSILMISTIKELSRRGKVAPELEGKGHDFEKVSESLLARWESFNYVRSAIPMIGAWIGLYAMLR